MVCFRAMKVNILVLHTTWMKRNIEWKYYTKNFISIQNQSMVIKLKNEYIKVVQWCLGRIPKWEVAMFYFLIGWRLFRYIYFMNIHWTVLNTCSLLSIYIIFFCFFQFACKNQVSKAQVSKSINMRTDKNKWWHMQTVEYYSVIKRMNYWSWIILKNIICVFHCYINVASKQ